MQNWYLKLKNASVHAGLLVGRGMREAQQSHGEVEVEMGSEGSRWGFAGAPKDNEAHGT